MLLFKQQAIALNQYHTNKQRLSIVSKCHREKNKRIQFLIKDIVPNDKRKEKDKYFLYYVFETHKNKKENNNSGFLLNVMVILFIWIVIDHWNLHTFVESPH